MIVDVAGAAAALQAADDILILTPPQTGRRHGRLCRCALPRSAADWQARIYSGKSGDHQALCAADRAVLSAGGFRSGVCGFDRYRSRKSCFRTRQEPYKGKVDLVIDHHGSNDGFGKKNLIRPDAGGCAEVLYDVLTALGVKFTADIAECIISVFRPIRAALSSPTRPRIRMR
ncbi:MAG: DHH family phosphoesterase [Butyricicoccaceae bacterium]